MAHSTHNNTSFLYNKDDDKADNSQNHYFRSKETIGYSTQSLMQLTKNTNNICSSSKIDGFLPFMQKLPQILWDFHYQLSDITNGSRRLKFCYTQ